MCVGLGLEDMAVAGDVDEGEEGGEVKAGVVGVDVVLA